MATNDTTHENDRNEFPAYRVTIDREACEGIFACLTRDPRFVESEDGLATVDPEADPAPPAGSDDGRIHEEEGRVVAEFADGRIEEARKAAAACPPNAITVERVTPDRTDERGPRGEEP